MKTCTIRFELPTPSTVLLPHEKLLGAEAARCYTYVHIEESENVNAKIWAGDHDGVGAGMPDRFVAEFPIGASSLPWSNRADFLIFNLL